MNSYYRELRINFSPCNADITDVMAALLADKGYESFVSDNEGLTAYVKDSDYSQSAVDEALSALPFDVSFTYDTKRIKVEDWNAVWEKNYFQPIVVGDRCVIHASFHHDVPKAEYDIVIDPKMAFGTGHHATTSQVIQGILQQDLTGKSVIDMGTGTGILAILCAMRGAKEVNGVEIDPPAYENALDNIRLNGVDSTVKIRLGDAATLPSLPKADLFIANINRNIITADLPAYVAAMNPGAEMLLSGFYETDIPVIMTVAEPLGLTEIGHNVQNDWTCLHLCIQEKKK